MMKLQDDDFALFSLPRRFALDRVQIDLRWRDLQRQVHPDKFASEGASAQRLAMQWSVRINEAHQRLKDPIRRAAYLCELHGAKIDAERNTTMPPAFLMLQIELREALDEAHSADALDQIVHKIQGMLRQMQRTLEREIDVEQRFDCAVQTVRSMMFFEKFLADVERAHERLEQ